MKEPASKPTQQVAAYLRFMGLGLTMIGIVLVFTFAGMWLDRQLQWGFPVFTVLLSLLGIVGAMLHLFRATGRK